ncbi:hypothetical protein M513_11409 [Trichuris suis]|uniref:Peptidase A2 domain-containing protein n=1 Tax=Trichuris suis TaxID=68888 RepID=A0A085LRY5_9BILA|nr:hypothetical protein M513_11409 [Trichuris suis]
MLVDTGAGRTLISSDVFHRVRGRVALRGSAVRLVLADGSPLPVVGEARLRIRLASKNFPIDAVVVDRLHYSVLLGIDFLTLHGFVVDLKRNVLSCEGVHAQVPLVLREGDQPNCVEECVYIAEDRNIAPRSTAAVSCSIKRTFSGDAIFESSHHCERQGGYAARSLATVLNGRFRTFILNPTQQEFCVKKGALLGKLTGIETEGTLLFCVKKGALLGKLTGIETEDACSAALATWRRNQMSHSSLKPALMKLAREAAGASLDERQISMLFGVLWNYRNVFAVGKRDLGRTKVLRHKITLTEGARPVRQPLRRLCPKDRKEVSALLRNLIDDKLIEPSESPWRQELCQFARRTGRFAYVWTTEN